MGPFPSIETHGSSVHQPKNGGGGGSVETVQYLYLVDIFLVLEQLATTFQSYPLSLLYDMNVSDFYILQALLL